MVNCRIYDGDEFDYHRELLYEGELNIEKLRELEKLCDDRTCPYCNYVPAFHITENNTIEFYTSGPWEC